MPDTLASPLLTWCGTNCNSKKDRIAGSSSAFTNKALLQGSCQLAFLINVSQEARKAGQACRKSSPPQPGKAAKLTGRKVSPGLAGKLAPGTVAGCGGGTGKVFFRDGAVHAAIDKAIASKDAVKLMRLISKGKIRCGCYFLRPDSRWAC
jgi:hypothetical protein